MTGSEFRAAREALGLSGAQMALILGYSGQPRISDIENRAEVPRPVALAVRAMLAFGLPDTWAQAPVDMPKRGET